MTQPPGAAVPTTVGAAVRRIGSKLGTCCGGDEPYATTKEGMLHIHKNYHALCEAMKKAHQRRAVRPEELVAAAMDLAAASIRMTLEIGGRVQAEQDQARRTGEECD